MKLGCIPQVSPTATGHKHRDCPRHAGKVQMRGLSSYATYDMWPYSYECKQCYAVSLEKVICPGFCQKALPRIFNHKYQQMTKTGWPVMEDVKVTLDNCCDYIGTSQNTTIGLCSV